MKEVVNRFRFLTWESVKEGNIRYVESVRRKKEEKAEKINLDKKGKSKDKKASTLAPDPRLEEGKKLSFLLGDCFSKKKFGGQLIDEIDPYYYDKRSFVVINKSKNIYRFTTTKAFFLFSPFNPVRTSAIKILTHPLFSIVVLLTIITNCIIMALNLDIKALEQSFTIIYAAEFLVKAFARGLIINDFTYLRSIWNWLDFLVIGLAYLMFIEPDLGNYSSLRTLRVFRALKTVTILPGMTTVVNALLNSVIKLKDAIVLTLFMLAIFALIGLQLYKGTLTQKCVKEFDNSTMNLDENSTVAWDDIKIFYNSPENWHEPHKVCSNSTAPCPPGYLCFATSEGNPNFGFTNYDTFPWAYLCAFRLMTQDFWEDLYQNTIRANGKIHVFFFMFVIFFGSFYLVNVILAIVAMSYDEARLKDFAKTAEEEAQKKEEEELMMEALEEDFDLYSEDLYFKAIVTNEEVESKSLKSCDDIYQPICTENLAQLFRSNSLNFYSNKDGASCLDKSQIEQKLDNIEINESTSMTNITLGDSEKEKSMDDNNEKIQKRRAAVFEIYEEKFKKSQRQLFFEMVEAKMCSWQFCPAYIKFQKCVSFIILDPFLELFITLCIVCNTCFMALEGPFTEESVKIFFRHSNYFFMGVFTFEAIGKQIALGLKTYFSERWNVFDFIVVIISLLELSRPNGVMSILRAFRLLRVFKLAKSWQTMNLLFTIIGHTVGAIGNLCIVLGIIVFIFAVLGMNTFHYGYQKYRNTTLYPEFEGHLPRWNFDDFYNSFMIVFRVLCGEYIESMWDCLRVNNYLCIPFFLLTMILGNLVILNLFLALLISSFSSESLERREEESIEINKLQQAFNRVYRAVVFIKYKFVKLFKLIKKRLLMYSWFRPALYPDPWNEFIEKKGTARTKVLFPNYDDNAWKWPSDLQIPQEQQPSFDFIPEITDAEIVYWNMPLDCLSRDAVDYLNRNCPCCFRNRYYRVWWRIRCLTFKVVDHKYFETFILFMIAFSSLTMTLEDKYLPNYPMLENTIYILDKVFTIVFLMEMLLKWMAIGLYKYFKDPWSCLDFAIVMIALISLMPFDMSRYDALKAMRTLRALRPLRAISRWEGMRIVVNALIQAIPSIFNVMVVCLVFWLIFSIIGVQRFGGRFYKCIYKDSKSQVSPLIVNSKIACETFANQLNITWINSKIHFDDVVNGLLALFQVATFKGWTDIIKDSVDVTDIDKQPRHNNSRINYIYYVLFIIFGSFFTLNLFIGVIIDNFNVQKKKVGGSLEMFMTDDQKKYYNAIQKMSSSSPQKPIPKPKNHISIVFYNICKNKNFDIVIMGFIVLNTLTMCIEFQDQPKLLTRVLDIVGRVFLLIFAGEFIMKLIGFRWFYFKDPWNVFDFSVVVFSTIAWILQFFESIFPLDPTLIRIVRLFRITRVLRLVKSARGIRTLLFSLVVSLPALFNIALLLMLVMFIYAIMGLSFFANVPHKYGIDETFNFETFFNSMIILFQISTTGGWHSVMDGLMNNESPECSEIPSPCGSKLLASSYLISYLIINAFVIVNMYIAVILENFSQATKDFQMGLTQDDYDLFYEVWEKYDPEATGFIPLSDLYDFVDQIGQPLGIAKPNKIQLAILEIPICQGNNICCMDVLDILTKNYLAESTKTFDPSVGVVDLKPTVKSTIADKKLIISNTYENLRAEWAARKITNLMRNFILRCKIKNQQT
uniref:Sodium channel protein n=1 Tax=Bdelloura candida TaxID=46766 RepID=O02037_BDECA|nr:voltage-gated sodium channel homolog BdNa1 [Bdelloura candida]